MKEFDYLKFWLTEELNKRGYMYETKIKVLKALKEVEKQLTET